MMKNFLMFSIGCSMLFAGASAFAQQAAADSTRTEKLPLANYDAPKQYIINNITVSGVKYQDPEILITAAGLAKGDTIFVPSEYLAGAIRKLWSQRFFSDVQMITEPVGDSVNIEIILQERPRVYRWSFDGIRKGQTTELLDKLKLKRGSELSDYVIKNSTDVIKKHFAEKGFLNTEVDLVQTNDSTIKNAVNVTFQINPKGKVKIGAVEFEGNTQFKDNRLRKTFKKTNQMSIKFWKGSKFKEAEFENDKENLLDFYNSQGYRNAVIVSDTIYNINDKRIGIKLTVDEGNKYYYRDIKWMGNSIYSTDDLNEMLGIKAGEAYDKKTLQKRLGVGKEASPDDQSISSLYQNAGYLFFQIEPSESIVGQDSLDLELKLFEGKQARVNEVVISGNMKVDDHVIRRELYVRPGELYDRSLLMETLRQLGQMKHFNPENLQPDLKPISAELVNISFPLEEVASDNFEVSGGWGAGMFVGSVGIVLNNVSLRNFFKGNEWRPYPAGQNQQLAIRGQTNGSYYKALSLNFTEPWLGGKKPNSLTLGLYYSDETNAYYFYQKGTKHFRTLGASVGIGRRLAWPDRNFTLYNEIGYQSYSLQDWDYFILKNGTANILTFKTIFGRNSVDQPIYPRKGSDFSVSLTLTPPYSLFDKKNYADKKMPEQERYKWIEFHKWQLKGQWFYALTNDQNLVLMAKAEMGYLGAYNKYKPSPFEGFDVGGDGMSGYNIYGVDIVGLRGYENGSLTPYSMKNDYARAYNKYTLELRYPFILKPSSTIYGLVFAEGGNAFPSWEAFNPFLIKRSLGAGVRLYLPIVGMIGVDWGYGFDKATMQSERSGSQIHFVMGMQF